MKIKPTNIPIKYLRSWGNTLINHICDKYEKEYKKPKKRKTVTHITKDKYNTLCGCFYAFSYNNYHLTTNNNKVTCKRCLQTLNKQKL